MTNCMNTCIVSWSDQGPSKYCTISYTIAKEQETKDHEIRSSSAQIKDLTTLQPKGNEYTSQQISN